MNLTLKRIAPMQAGKMLAAFYGLISLIFVPFMLAFMAFGSLAARSQGGSAPAMPLMFGMGLGFMIMLPLLYAVMGFIGGVIGAWVYNLLAGWIGGFEFDFEAKTPPPV
jgi:hypothetical protein